MKTKKFTPVFLFQNEDRIKQAKENIERGSKHLNQFVALVENILNTKFDDNEKNELKKKEMAFIFDIVKPEFQFPKATEEFNLQALGIDLTPVKDFYNKHSHSWKNQHFNLIEGEFMADEQLFKDEIEKFSYYTTNQRQNEALKIAEDLKAQFLKAEAAGLVSRFNQSDIYNVTELIEYSLNSQMKPGWQINYHYIKNLK